jgi:hypothetical protein
MGLNLVLNLDGVKHDGWLKLLRQRSTKWPDKAAVFVRREPVLGSAPQDRF